LNLSDIFPWGGIFSCFDNVLLYNGLLRHINIKKFLIPLVSISKIKRVGVDGEWKRNG
jgi:hypothetical protein